MGGDAAYDLRATNNLFKGTYRRAKLLHELVCLSLGHSVTFLLKTVQNRFTKKIYKVRNIVFVFGT